VVCLEGGAYPVPEVKPRLAGAVWYLLVPERPHREVSGAQQVVQSLCAVAVHGDRVVDLTGKLGERLTDLGQVLGEMLVSKER
jgi:hypothetical protein